MDVPRVGEIYEIQAALYAVRQVDTDKEQIRLELADNVVGKDAPASRTYSFQEWGEADFSLR